MKSTKTIEGLVWGKYEYSKTGNSTARLTLYDLWVSDGESYYLTFTSATTGSYRMETSPGWMRQQGSFNLSP